MTELERWRCPACGSVYDVWVDDDGAPEDEGAYCPEGCVSVLPRASLRLGEAMVRVQRVQGVRDDEETGQWSS